MNFKMRKSKLVFATVAFFTFASAIIAQEQEPTEPPKPAGRGIPGLDELTPDQNAADDSGWNADTMPITGLQTPTIGSPGLQHSYLVPGFQYGSTIQPPLIGSSNSGEWYSDNYFGANLSLLQQWSGSRLALNYSAGGFVTNGPGQSNGWYQQLAFGQAFMWRRWQMQIFDQFAYLPQSQFGFGAGTGLGLPGISGPLGPSIPAISNSVVPNQSIYAAFGPQYDNSIVTQLTYQTSQRGSITMSGSYGLLRFTQAGNVDTNSYIGSVGYNYLLTKEDSIGIFYRFTAYHYEGQPQALGDQMINVAYVRKITKRLALQIYGGPEITTYRIPVGNQSQTVAGDAGIKLTNSFQNGAVSGSYFHSLTGGSGILIGSSTDQVNISASRRLTRLWTLQSNFGFAKNRPLGNGVGVQGTGYTSIYVGGGVSRPIGRNVNLSVAYQAQIQQESQTICTVPGCSTSYSQNSVTINFQWHMRPFVLE